jgi:hypothetical protein
MGHIDEDDKLGLDLSAGDAIGSGDDSNVGEDGRIGLKADTGDGSISLEIDFRAVCKLRETPVVAATMEAAAAAAITTATKSAERFWRLTPGPFRKSRKKLMALVLLLPQLRPLGDKFCELDKKRKKIGSHGGKQR